MKGIRELKMAEQNFAPMSRRSLFRMIGMAAGSAVMYQAMTDLGYAGESGYTGPTKLSGDVKGATVVVLGAGLAGLTAALELHNAGYKVQVLEYQHKAGGRNISIRGGDTVTAVAPRPADLERLLRVLREDAAA